MISLQKLLTTDADASTSGLLSGKADTSAQDFLALLSSALSGNPVQGEVVEGEGTTLTLADLQAASAKLQKGLLTKGTDDADSRTPAAQLADILARQAAKTDVAADVTADEDLAATLTTGLKTDSLAVLNKAAKTDDDETSTLSEEELAGLSALLAMLPHQQDAKATTATAATVTGASLTPASAAKTPALSITADDRDAASTDKADISAATTPTKNDTGALTAQLQNADSVSQAAAQSAAHAAKADAQTAAQAINTTVSTAPVVSTAAAAQASVPVAAPVISAPLGSSEWQQTISQNITMFTRQGKQSAELRLHPEDLGQVQISLKIDDNQAQLQMVSQHSHVRAALEAALPVLRTNLAENGIELSQSSISSENFAGQQQSSSQQQQTSRSGGGQSFGAEEDELLAVPASLQSAARGNNAVDIFA
nr:flagellar hook length control protein FliK [uncultured Enterobacter sp.]